MVETVEDWKVLEGYAGFKQGFYQIIEEENITDVRVNVGRLGFKKEFDDPKDPLISHIIKLCKSECYVKLDNTIEADHFFK